MTTRKRIGIGLVLVVLLALVVLGVWLLGTSIVATLGLVPSATRVAVIGLVGIVLVPLIAFFTTRSLERHRARDDAIREKRTEFYDKTIRGMIRNLGIDKTADTPTPDAQARFIAEITPDFILYGSRDVVLAWNRFRQVGQQDEPTQETLLLAFEGLLRAMRKDLGHTVSPQPNLELLKVFVNDIDTIVPQKQRVRRASKGQIE